MATPDSIALNVVARDAGFRERISYFLLKKADEVIDQAVPDTNELELAKTLLYPANTNEASIDAIVEHFARTIVTVSAVATNLAANDFDHLAFTDTGFETQVNALWPSYAKSIV